MVRPLARIHFFDRWHLQEVSAKNFFDGGIRSFLGSYSPSALNLSSNAALTGDAASSRSRSFRWRFRYLPGGCAPTLEWTGSARISDQTACVDRGSWRHSSALRGGSAKAPTLTHPPSR